MFKHVTKHASPLLLRRGVRGEAGQIMEIRVHLPTAPAYAAIGFEHDSAFPSPTLMAAVPELVLRATEAPEARLMIFGHADEAGSESHNKKLGDRRAKVMLALLTLDLTLFDQVAKADGWKLIQYQAMLKALGLTPMDVDGKPGPKTTRGVKRFQQGYNTSAYHPEGGRTRAHDKLKADGELGARTEAALRDAYLAQLTTSLDAARFFGPKFAGCGEFNRMGSPEQDRRAVLTLYRPDFPTESKIPCKEGDDGACAINMKAKHRWLCNFYRRTIEGETVVEGVPIPVPVPLTAQTVDEFGYRFGGQVITFVDGAGTKHRVSTDENGVFEGILLLAGESLDIELADGTIQPVWLERITAPAIIDVVVPDPSAAEFVAERRLLDRLYDRTPLAYRRSARGPVADGVIGEGWTEITDRATLGVLEEEKTDDA